MNTKNQSKNYFCLVANFYDIGLWSIWSKDKMSVTPSFSCKYKYLNIITPLISVQLYSHHTTHKQQSNSSIVRTYNHTRGTYYTLILSPIQATALPANLPTTYVCIQTHTVFFPPICFICKNITIYFHHLIFPNRTKSGINSW